MPKLDFNRIGIQAKKSRVDTILDPRDLFSALPDKPKDLDYLRGPQDQVLSAWHARRSERDLVIKMNTGGGKTIVGLLIAKSLLNEGLGPVAYLVPDDFLLDQVQKEAKRLGLTTAQEPRDADVQQGRAILIDSFASLFNARSVFGVEGTVNKTPTCLLESIVVDDAHACVAHADQKFRLTITRNEGAYNQLLDLFTEDLRQQSPGGYLDVESGKYGAMMEVPFWAWQTKQDQVINILHPLGDTSLEWYWPLVVDSLALCTAVIASDSIDIQPSCYPTDILTGFAQAKRRVYLTATLADDSVLVRHFGAAPESVANPIFPASAGDIGDRMILVPQQLLPSVTDEDLRDFVMEAAQHRNVVVIVPSHRRAQWWSQHATEVLDRNNIHEGVAKLLENPKAGLVVLVNRYDGVDLPDDACHFLVLDGLPEALDGVERREQAQLSGSASVLGRQVQRLEQGMGRATRSNGDHAVVFLLGSKLANRLNNPDARSMFSPATQAQLDIAEVIAREASIASLADLNEIIDQCLHRDEGWVTYSRGQLAEVRYDKPQLPTCARLERQAFGEANSHSYADAARHQGETLDEARDDAHRGLLLQRQAAYTNFFDPTQAQSLQKRANELNRRLIRPLNGVTYQRLTRANRPQGEQASAWLQSTYASGNDLVLGINALLGELNWGPRTKQFEQALCDLARHIGLKGQRPEEVVGRGPDDLWAFPDGSFFVIEAKSGATDGHTVSKDDAKQLSNAMDWFANQYPNSTGTPILVHPDPRFDFHAAIPQGCRVITTDKLAAIRESLLKYATGLASAEAYRDPHRVTGLLSVHGFVQEEFVSRHTEKGRQARGN